MVSSNGNGSHPSESCECPVCTSDWSLGDKVMEYRDPLDDSMIRVSFGEFREEAVVALFPKDRNVPFTMIPRSILFVMLGAFLGVQCTLGPEEEGKIRKAWAKLDD